jgi:hypothetical protein
MQKQRRDFLKIAAAGAAGLALTRADKAFAAWPGTGTLAVNPNISNMRVVSCVDTTMVKSTPAMTFAGQNAAIDSARVQANMDAMAMQLANQTTADAAWKAIFRTGKGSWAATKVAIKINAAEAKNMAHIAILQKLCTILVGYGVLPANIVIYDGQIFNSGAANYASYVSLTDTTKVLAVLSNLSSALGGMANAAIPGGSSTTCAADIANGVIDIVINIASNKGHDMAFNGGTTLCMKNHFGTFAPKHDVNYMFNINKSDALLGGNPVRQQLCFVDSLFANKTKNMGTPEVMPCYLIMGVFAPAVDYLTVKKVREAVLGCTHDAAIINSYLTTFGYATTDPVWVVVPPAGGGTSADGGAGGTGGTSASGGAGGGGTSGSGGARTGGSSGSGGTGSGGSSGSGGTGSGGSSGSGGTGSGGASGSGGTGSGGSSGSGGARTGGSSGSGGTGSGGSSGSGGVASGGTSVAGGAGSGGATATGGTPGSGGTTSGGAGGTGGAATSVASASGGSATTGGTSAGSGTSVSSVGGRSGTTSAKVAGGNSGSGCDIAGVDRRATRWGAMLALGAVVAGKLRRLLGGSDGSS